MCHGAGLSLPLHSVGHLLHLAGCPGLSQTGPVPSRIPETSSSRLALGTFRHRRLPQQHPIPTQGHGCYFSEAQPLLHSSESFRVGQQAREHQAAGLSMGREMSCVCPARVAPNNRWPMHT